MRHFEVLKRLLIWIFIAVICFLLQTNIFQYVALAGVVPNLFVILVVSIAYMRGQNESMAIAFICGLMIDFMYGDVIGLYTLFYIIIAYTNGFFHRIYYDEDFTIPIILVGISDFVYNFLTYITNFLLRNRLDLWYYISRIILPEIVYTVLISILMYKVLHSINGWVNRYLEKEV